MMIRGDWRYFRDDAPRPFPTVMALTAVVFAVAWVFISVMLLGALALRSF